MDAPGAEPAEAAAAAAAAAGKKKTARLRLKRNKGLEAAADLRHQRAMTTLTPGQRPQLTEMSLSLSRSLPLSLLFALIADITNKSRYKSHTI